MDGECGRRRAPVCCALQQQLPGVMIIEACGAYEQQRSVFYAWCTRSLFALRSQSNLFTSLSGRPAAST